MKARLFIGIAAAVMSLVTTVPTASASTEQSAKGTTCVSVEDPTGNRATRIQEYGISYSEWPDGTNVMWIVDCNRHVFVSYQLTAAGPYQGWKNFGGIVYSRIDVIGGTTWYPSIYVTGVGGVRYHRDGNRKSWTPWLRA